jgi:hypothetical protein
MPLCLQVLWLKKHMPKDLFEQCMFFDLPDMLTYKATGDLSRSNCSLACKCSYVPPGVEGSKGWNDDFFKQIGLEEFVRFVLCFLPRPADSIPLTYATGLLGLQASRGNSRQERTYSHGGTARRQGSLSASRLGAGSCRGNARRVRRHRRLRWLGGHGRCTDGGTERYDARRQQASVGGDRGHEYRQSFTLAFVELELT